MNYPIWEVPLIGGGIVIALIAVPHIFFSHFAIGGSLYLVLTEHKAYRENDERVLNFVRQYTPFFVVIVLVVGALTGVGIWFSIALVSPEGTSSLLRVFMWLWASEWVLFLVEIIAAFAYYYGWGRLSRRAHLAVGWVYFVAAWFSLFIINGILSFMMTPGDWVESRSLVDAFFNATFYPSTLLRTMVAVALAGAFALIAASRIREDDLREKMVRYSGQWLAVAFLLMPVGLVWYLTQVPSLARDIAFGAAAAPQIFLILSLVLSALIFGFALLGPYLNPRLFYYPFAIVIFVLAFIVTGSSEMFREAVRKPFVIYDYMYSNQVRLDEVAELNREGVLASAKWSSVSRVEPVNDPGTGHEVLKLDCSACHTVNGNELEVGREVFKLDCSACHTVRGYNPVAPLVKDWSEGYIDFQLQRLDELKPFMPPFIGTAAERKALAAWLASLD